MRKYLRELLEALLFVAITFGPLWYWLYKLPTH